MQIEDSMPEKRKRPQGTGFSALTASPKPQAFSSTIESHDDARK